MDDRQQKARYLMIREAIALMLKTKKKTTKNKEC